MDFKEFEEKLYKFGLESFLKIRRKRPHDNFYCYAFYTSGEFSWIATTVSSYEGLEEVALQYKSKERYSHQSLTELKHELKWSPADSPLHEDPGEFLEPLQPFLDQISNDLYNIEIIKDDWTEFREYVAQAEIAIENALKRIDAQGVFGKGEERKGVIINLLMGDQSDEARINFASKVNPVESVEMLVRDLEILTH